MRLETIENPDSLFLRIAYWLSRRQFGKVLTPLKVIYARKPALLKIVLKINKFEEKKISLAPDLRLFVKIAGAAQNGCGFCTDIALAQAVKDKIGTEKFNLILNADAAPPHNVFSEKERSLLNFIREYANEKKTCPETFARLQMHFSEEEIVEIVALNAFEQFFNALTIPLGIESDGLRSLAEDSI